MHCLHAFNSTDAPFKPRGPALLLRLLAAGASMRLAVQRFPTPMTPTSNSTT